MSFSVPFVISVVQTMPCEHNAVDHDIDHQRDSSELELIRSRQPLRVEQRQNVMRHEVAAVWRSAFGAPQCVFQGCQGTNPPAEFDQHAPGDSGHVQPDRTPPPDGEQPAENDEDDE